MLDFKHNNNLFLNGCIMITSPFSPYLCIADIILLDGWFLHNQLYPAKELYSCKRYVIDTTVPPKNIGSKIKH